MYKVSFLLGIVVFSSFVAAQAQPSPTPAASETPPPTAAPPALPTNPPAPSQPVQEFSMLQGGVSAGAPCPQPPGAYTHDGFYLRTGSSTTYVAISGEGPAGHVAITGIGSGGMFTIGGNVATGLVVGATLGAESLRRTSLSGAPTGGPGKVDASHVNIGVLVDWFPNPRAGWHVGGSLGFGGVQMMDDNVNWFGVAGAGSVFGGTTGGLGPSGRSAFRSPPQARRGRLSRIRAITT